MEAGEEVEEEDTEKRDGMIGPRCFFNVRFPERKDLSKENSLDRNCWRDFRGDAERLFFTRPADRETGVDGEDGTVFFFVFDFFVVVFVLISLEVLGDAPPRSSASLE